jgi:hypothetical protein
MNQEIKEKIERVYDMFPGAFIYKNDEIILDKKLNVYFRIDNIENADHFNYKILSCCSFYCANNHFNPSSKTSKYFNERINRWFKKKFSNKEMQIIYQKLGNQCNQKLGIEFIKSGCDLSLLNNTHEA